MRFVVLIFALISFSAQAQLNDRYTRDGEAYNFHVEDNTFFWVKTAAETTYGNGHYKINGKKLELKFEKAELRLDFQINEVKPADKCIVEVRIMYSNGQPASGAVISLIQSGVRQGVDKLGVLKLELSNPSAEDKIVIELDGRKSFAFQIKLKGHSTLLGIVVDETVKYKENVTETLSIKIKRTKILLNGKAFQKVGALR